MNNLPVREAFNRAMSHWRYWNYRRIHGNPISLVGAIREGVRRFFFEWTKP